MRHGLLVQIHVVPAMLYMCVDRQRERNTHYVHTYVCVQATHHNTFTLYDALRMYAIYFSFLQIDLNSQFGSSTLVPYTIIPINTTGCGPGAGLHNTLRATELT